MIKIMTKERLKNHPEFTLIYNEHYSLTHIRSEKDPTRGWCLIVSSLGKHARLTTSSNAHSVLIKIGVNELGMYINMIEEEF